MFLFVRLRLGRLILSSTRDILVHVLIGFPSFRYMAKIVSRAWLITPRYGFSVWGGKPRRRFTFLMVRSSLPRRLWTIVIYFPSALYFIRGNKASSQPASSWRLSTRTIGRVRFHSGVCLRMVRLSVTVMFLSSTLDYRVTTTRGTSICLGFIWRKVTFITGMGIDIIGRTIWTRCCACTISFVPWTSPVPLSLWGPYSQRRLAIFAKRTM